MGGIRRIAISSSYLCLLRIKLFYPYSLFETKMHGSKATSDPENKRLSGFLMASGFLIWLCLSPQQEVVIVIPVSGICVPTRDSRANSLAS